MGLDVLTAARVFRAQYLVGLEGATDFPWIDRLATRINTDQRTEDLRWIGQLPVVQEFTGQRRATPLRDYGYQAGVKTFDLTQEFGQDDLDDNKFDMIARKIRAMPKRGMQHRAKRLIQWIQAGDGTTLGKAYDGANYFSTSHSEGASGTQSNLLTHSATAPAAPTVAEFEAALNTSSEKFYDLVDDQGEPINEDLQELTVMVPVKYRNVAKSAMGAQVIVDGGTSRTSLFQIVNDDIRYTLVVVPRLGKTDNTFYTFRTDVEEGPFIYLVRRDMDDPRFVDDTAKHRKVLYIMEGRYDFHFGMWQFAQQNNFS